MATRIILFTVFCFFLPGCGEAQFTDNFSDGDFTLNPTWEGDQSKFSINSGRMRLAAPAVAGNSYLATLGVAR